MDTHTETRPIQITTTHQGRVYTLEGVRAADGTCALSISRDGAWAGSAQWDGSQLECAAVLPEDVYDHLDAAMVEGAGQ